MDEQALSKRVRALNKAVENEPPTVVLKMLEEMKRENAPTEEQLRVSVSRWRRLGV
jgi:transcription elongation factor S-II